MYQILMNYLKLQRQNAPSISKTQTEIKSKWNKIQIYKSKKSKIDLQNPKNSFTERISNEK